MTASVIVLSLGESRIGVMSSAVQRILPMAIGAPPPTRLDLVEDILDWHGKPLPVLDIRRRLGLSACPPVLTDRLVVVQLRGQVVALRVEDVLDMIEVPAEVIQASQEMSPSLPGVAGITRLKDGVLLIYDVNAFLTEAEAISLRDALEIAHE